MKKTSNASEATYCAIFYYVGKNEVQLSKKYPIVDLEKVKEHVEQKNSITPELNRHVIYFKE